MEWHKEMLRGFRDNAAYEGGRALILLIAPFVLAPIYTVLSRLGAWNWNWRVHAGLIFIAVVILGFTAWKLIKQGPRQRGERRKDDPPAFEIEALADANLSNLTERAFDTRGKTTGWSAECIVSIHNLYPTQGIDDVMLRILSITPPMSGLPSHHPRTQDTTLRRAQFTFDDIPAGKALFGDQTGHVRLFRATRHGSNVDVKFYGKWPDNTETAFNPKGDHILTVEVTGIGIKRAEAHFRLVFSTRSDEPALTISKVDRPDSVSTQQPRIVQETPPRAQPLEIPMPFREQRVGFLQFDKLDYHNSSFVAGEPFGVTVWFANRGSFPVYDAQGFALLIYCPTIYPTVDEDIRRLGREAVEKEWERDDGSQVAVGAAIYFPTSVSMSQEEISLVLSGRSRIYLLTFAKWKSDTGEPVSPGWEQCSWMEPPKSDHFDPLRIKWRMCKRSPAS